MQLQTMCPESKFPNRSTFEKVIEKIQRGPDFIEHGVNVQTVH